MLRSDIEKWIVKMKEFFITATDTDAGKTFCAVALMNALTSQGHKVAGFKPIAAGAKETAQGLFNEDAVKLNLAANVELNYEQVNTICFKPAIAPHIAAAEAKRPIHKQALNIAINQLRQKQDEIDHLIIEGAGGWLLPINEVDTLADWVENQQLSVILVVSMKLGCLNHAMLTYQNILSRGLRLAGWIINETQADMPYLSQNIEYLSDAIEAPLLGHIPYIPIDEEDQYCLNKAPDPEIQAASLLDIEPLMGIVG